MLYRNGRRRKSSRKRRARSRGLYIHVYTRVCVCVCAETCHLSCRAACIIKLIGPSLRECVYNRLSHSLASRQHTFFFFLPFLSLFLRLARYILCDKSSSSSSSALTIGTRRALFRRVHRAPQEFQRGVYIYNAVSSSEVRRRRGEI